MTDWWKPSEIYFSREQCIWLIQYLDLLKEGRWPPDPSGGYTDAAAQSSLSSHAIYETPCQFAAEIERRIEVTKRDGKLLIWQIRAGVELYEDLEPESKIALNYISINDFRKRSPYPEWRRGRIGHYHRPKNTKGIKNLTKYE
jgi:hypothetical protein